MSDQDIQYITLKTAGTQLIDISVKLPYQWSFNGFINNKNSDQFDIIYIFSGPSTHTNNAKQVLKSLSKDNKKKGIISKFKIESKKPPKKHQHHIETQSDSETDSEQSNSDTYSEYSNSDSEYDSDSD